jgi:hypothetical protein
MVLKYFSQELSYRIYNSNPYFGEVAAIPDGQKIQWPYG